MAASVEFSFPSTSRSTISQNAFLQSVHNHFQNVMEYEDDKLLEVAISYVPVAKIQMCAIERMRSLQKDIKTGSLDAPEMHLEEAILIELVKWFKTSFFSWVDCPPCHFCSGATKHSFNTEKRDAKVTIRVEIFKCTLCDTETEFPRYNDLATLLITRKGRCGEWAKCFMLFCRAMKYDTRLVVDNTDHVWTEIYSPILKRWLHCDPCENVIDAPLMYEAGWGKKLDYIIAYSKDEVQDITWKYSSNHRDLLTRRNMCTENELITTLIAMRDKRWEILSLERKKFIRKRLCTELVDMMKEREPNENEKSGRSSGSLDWRLQRMETSWKPYVWNVGEHQEVSIKYRTSTNTYEIALLDGTTVKSKKSWENAIYEMKDIFRKEETDWKMTYLARTEGSENAKISWKFKVDNNNKVIDRINIRVSSQAYQSGKIEWILCYDDNCTKIPKESEKHFTLENLNTVTEFTLTAYLSGGEGRTAWQHSQILRQGTDSLDYPMEITIRLRNSS
ncbi:N-glycanase Pngl [Arctopsyche grandis]|uniref:N-glycanase Pngl n=1 Tax=Arctopsyche grandis TaxID=121162 RepID=UPI00406D6E5A